LILTFTNTPQMTRLTGLIHKAYMERKVVLITTKLVRQTMGNTSALLPQVHVIHFLEHRSLIACANVCRRKTKKDKIISAASKDKLAFLNLKMSILYVS